MIDTETKKLYKQEILLLESLVEDLEREDASMVGMPVFNDGGDSIGKARYLIYLREGGDSAFVGSLIMICKRQIRLYSNLLKEDNREKKLSRAELIDFDED